MDTYNVKPIFNPAGKVFDEDVSVPGSKSMTNRALLLSALSHGQVRLCGAQNSDDARHFLQCLKDLGFQAAEERSGDIVVQGEGGKIPKKSASLNVGSAGTAARFIPAMLAFSQGTYHLDASDQMRRRPMAPLLDALKELGCTFTFSGEPEHYPFRMETHGVTAKEITIDIGQSSQFLSALLMASVMSGRDFTCRIRGTHGMSYIRMTVRMMQQFGADTLWQSDAITVKGPSFYQMARYDIEPDVSAACYFYAMAAELGGSVLVRGVHKTSLQGDIRFLDVLKDMGCRICDRPEGIRLTGPEGGRLRGVTADMCEFSDQALTLAAIAPFASSPVTIKNIGHIRLQESNRLEVMERELRRMGIKTQTGEDFITIFPGRPQPAEIHTYQDHRAAMAFAVTGLRAPGITILNPDCCRKTFAEYFSVLENITARYPGR